MRFNLKITCEGHRRHDLSDLEWIRSRNGKVNLDSLGPRSCITPMQEFLDKPPALITWHSVSWAIFPPPCWPSSVADVVEWFNEEIGPEIARTHGAHTSQWDRLRVPGQVVIHSGFSNQYKFAWEVFQHVQCANCGRSPIDCRSWENFRKVNQGSGGIPELLMDEIGFIADEWVYCLKREKELGIQRTRDKARVIIDVCGDDCAEAIVGRVYRASQQVKKELLEWRRKRQIQRSEEEAIQVSRSLMGKARKAIREGNQEALQSLREEFERVATLR